MSKILVIEDDPGLMESYKVGLGHAGFTVLTALDGETGLETAKSAKPDLIILDQILPKMPGVEVLEHLKKDPQTATIPVIIASNIDSPERRIELEHDGVVAFIPKSDSSMQDIVTCIKDALKA